MSDRTGATAGLLRRFAASHFPSSRPPHLPLPPLSPLQIFLRFGTPALRPFPAALAPWMQGIAVSTEFFHLLLSTLMVRGGHHQSERRISLGHSAVRAPFFVH